MKDELVGSEYYKLNVERLKLTIDLKMFSYREESTQK